MIVFFHRLYVRTTKVGEWRHIIAGAPDNRIEGSFRTCTNAPGKRPKPGTWTGDRALTGIALTEYQWH